MKTIARLARRRICLHSLLLINARVHLKCTITLQKTEWGLHLHCSNCDDFSVNQQSDDIARYEVKA